MPPGLPEPPGDHEAEAARRRARAVAAGALVGVARRDAELFSVRLERFEDDLWSALSGPYAGHLGASSGGSPTSWCACSSPATGSARRT